MRVAGENTLDIEHTREEIKHTITYAVAAAAAVMALVSALLEVAAAIAVAAEHRRLRVHLQRFRRRNEAKEEENKSRELHVECRVGVVYG